MIYIDGVKVPEDLVDRFGVLRFVEEISDGRYLHDTEGMFDEKTVEMMISALTGSTKGIELRLLDRVLDLMRYLDADDECEGIVRGSIERYLEENHGVEYQWIVDTCMKYIDLKHYVDVRCGFGEDSKMDLRLEAVMTSLVQKG